MTSVLKSSLTYDDSALVQGETADVTDVLAATNDLLENDQAGRVAVSAADTHVKNLEDALDAGSGILITKVNTAADESLAIAVDTTVVATLAGSQTLTNKVIGATNDVALGALDQGGGAPGDAIMWNGSSWSPAPPGGVVTSPVDVTTIVAGEALSERDFVYLSATGWKKVDIDASPVLMGRWRGLVNEVGGIANGALGSVRLMGEVTGFTGLTANAFVWASSTAGGYTQTKPSPSLGGSQVAVVPIGLAISTTRILLLGPSRMEYRKRASTANNATILIEHHDDPFGDGREARGFVSSTDIISMQTYASANQDTNLQLKGVALVTTISAVGSTEVHLGDSGGTDRRIAQPFTVAISGRISEATVRFGVSVGTPVGPVTCAIYTEASGNLGTLIQSTTFTPTASSNNTIPFPTSAYVSTGTTYLLLLEAPLQASGARWTVWVDATTPSLLKDETTGASFPNTFSALGTATLRCTVTSLTVTRFAQGFSNSTSESVPSIRIYARKQGSPTGDLTVAIYSDSAGVPDTLLGTSQ